MDLYNIEVNVTTGEVTQVPFTPEEVAAYEAAVAAEALLAETTPTEPTV
jgi:hypothetical protein